MALDLRSPKYGQRIVRSRKVYTRKEKHGTRRNKETNAESVEEVAQLDVRDGPDGTNLV